MKILFINPPFARFGGVEGHGGVQAPLNLSYLASYLRMVEPHHNLKIFDAEATGSDFDDVEAVCREFQPQIVAITMPTPAYLHGLETAYRAKKVNGDTWVVVGGPHPSAFARETVLEKDVDFAVSGEGEMAFTHLVRTLERGGDLKQIGGVAFQLDDDAVHYNSRKTLIDNLDDIPFPARDLLPMDRYVITGPKRTTGRRGGNMITSRGCPYDCTFCESKVLWTRATRLRSVENIVDEIQECNQRYGIGEINFHDDILPMKRDRTLELCKEIRKRKLDVNWVCMSRANFVWDDVMLEMRKAGCKKIMFGFESGSNEILKIIKKKATIEQAREAVKICRRARIKVMGSFMIGNVGENEETVRQTIDFAKELDLDTASFFVAMPYLGTELFQQAKAKGYLQNEIQWKDFAVLGSSNPPMVLPDLPPQRLLELQAQAIREFYLRPSYMVRKLLGLRSFGEFWNLVSGLKILRRVAKNTKEPTAVEGGYRNFLESITVTSVVRVNDLILDEEISFRRPKVKSDLSVIGRRQDDVPVHS